MISDYRRFVHILSSLERGGAESVTLDLIRSLHSAGHSNLVLCLGGRTGELYDEYIKAGAEIRVLNLGDQPILTLLAMCRIAVRYRPDAVVSNLSLPSAVLLLPFALTGVSRRIARVHSDSDGRSGTLRVEFRRHILRTLMRFTATRILAVSPAALDFAGGRGRVVPNGVDTSEFYFRQRCGSEKYRVISVGRPDPAKNRRRLLGISDELVARGEQPIKVIGPVGDDIGPDDEPRVEVSGPRSPMAPEYANADCLVVVSVREGLPGVVLEALASGVPVVSSPLSGVKMLAESVDGISIVDLDDSDATWATEIIRACLLRRSSEARTISESIRASDYNVDLINRRWFQELGLLPGHGSGLKQGHMQ